MSILDIIIFLFFTGGVVGRTFPSGLGCGNVYFRNVCE